LVVSKANIVEECDLKSLQTMFLKCYHHLHLVENYDVESIEHKSYEDNNLNIFEMIVSKSEPVTKLVNKEFLICTRFQMDPKKIKCPSGLCEALFASFWVVHFSVCWGYCEFLKHVVVNLLVFFILKPLACSEQAT
jgi:hypothetical protein